MVLLNILSQRTLKKLDISSRYAYYIGLGSLVVSIIVGVRIFFKLWLETNTHFLVALVVAIIVFYIFTQLYSFVVLFGLRFLEKKEEIL